MSDSSLSDDVDMRVRRTRRGTEDDAERAVALAIRERRRIARRMQSVSAQLWLSSRPLRAARPADHGLADDHP